MRFAREQKTLVFSIGMRGRDLKGRGIADSQEAPVKTCMPSKNDGSPSMNVKALVVWEKDPFHSFPKGTELKL